MDRTHSFDQAQRSLELRFLKVDSDTLNVATPAQANLAPPGWYMLFIATGTNGCVPSTARWIRLLPQTIT